MASSVSNGVDRQALEKVRQLIDEADAIVIGAGAGLSAAGGLTYSGPRFEDNFKPFIAKYGMRDMYSAGFYPFQTEEEKWAYWSRHILINRFDAPVGKPYTDLLSILKAVGGGGEEVDAQEGKGQEKGRREKSKEFFVITTNVDAQFERAGFPTDRLFATQGDYGKFQCARGCHDTLYSNEAVVRLMVMHQQDCQLVGISTNESDELAKVAESAAAFTSSTAADVGAADAVSALLTALPSSLVPQCPRCKGRMANHLRIDGSFVENSDWHVASDRYERFLRRHLVDYIERQQFNADNGSTGRRVGNDESDAKEEEEGESNSPKPHTILFLELGVGMNTPNIIKIPFMQMVAKAASSLPSSSPSSSSSSSLAQWRKAAVRADLVTLNLEAFQVPSVIRDHTIAIVGDIGLALADLAAPPTE